MDTDVLVDAMPTPPFGETSVGVGKAPDLPSPLLGVGGGKPDHQSSRWGATLEGRGLPLVLVHPHPLVRASARSRLRFPSDAQPTFPSANTQAAPQPGCRVA